MDDQTTMTSSRPYIFRAIYDWIIDNGLTPYILVNAEVPGARLPERHVENGKIILNISPRAVSHWQQDRESLSFSARFGGVNQEVSVPINGVLAIYAKENGKGMVFEKEEGVPPPSSPRPDKGKRRRAHLQVVK